MPRTSMRASKRLADRPRSLETRRVYQLITTVHSALGDQTREIVRSAADAVLETIKSEFLEDLDKRKEVEGSSFLWAWRSLLSS